MQDKHKMHEQKLMYRNWSNSAFKTLKIYKLDLKQFVTISFITNLLQTLLIAINEILFVQIKNIVIKMFQFNNSFHELPDNFDYHKPGVFDLPTTTHNSPGSLKSASFQFQDSPFNCSFDQGSQSNHAQAIWEASIKYLQSSLKQFVDMAKGLNDDQLYHSMNGNETLCEESLEQIIFRNSNLKIQQKHQFISDLQNQSQLIQLMKELSKLFNQNVFHEITYVIFKIWQKKNENQKTKSNNLSEQEPLIPHFDCFWGYQEQEVPKISYAPIFEEKNIDSVVQDADKCAQEIAQELYFDNRLKFLNLKDCKKDSVDQMNVATLFSQFFKTLTRSVFLSTEGFYNQPGKEGQTNACSQFEDFDFEFNEVSALEELQLNQNKFIRSFSQDFEDDEDFEFSSSLNKKRKLQ